MRDALVLVAVFAVLLGGLYLYTGTWPPAVIVESGSMMHADSEVGYGRFGTIDPGDLVLVKNVDDAEDVQTLVEGGDGTYGKSGDVIVFYRNNDRRATPVIHRAVAYVEVVSTTSGGTYRVRWTEDAPCVGGATKADGNWCVYGSGGVSIPSIPVEGERPRASGFLTKGDNPSTNTQIDQDTALSLDEPVRLEWIEGKARAEIPWLGLIKLSVAPQYNQQSCARGPVEFHFFDASASRECQGWIAFGHAWAPKDLWVMLGIALFLLVAVPLVWDVVKNVRQRRADAVETAPPVEEPPR